MSRLILLGLVWAALSAATAYFADLWGRKLGKQRKSLFGWRPKQTAVFIITSAGAVISLLSFAVLLTADAGIRNSLTQWDQVVRELKSSNTQMAEMNTQMQEMRQTAIDDREKAVAAQAAREHAEADLHNAEAAERIQRQRVIAAQRKYAEVSGDLRDLRVTLGTTNANLREAQNDLDRVTANLGRTKTELAARKRELDEAQHVLARAQEALKGAGEAARRTLQGSLQADRLIMGAASGKFIVRRDDDVIVRTVIPPQASLQGGREAIARALNQARMAVMRRSEERGVRYQPGSRILQIRRKPLPVPDSTPPRYITFTESQVLDAVATQLMKPNAPSPGGVVLQVVGANYALPGETVDVDFQLFENHIVFEKGTEITRFVVNRGETREQVMQDITNALQDVRKAALKNGLMKSSDDSVSAISLFQLAETYNRVVDAITRDQSRIPVVISAEEDTWTPGPLKLRFLVKRSEAET